MTKENLPFRRRSVLKTIGGLAVASGTFTGVSMANNLDEVNRHPADVLMYSGEGDDPDDFGYPDGSIWSAHDGDGSLYPPFEVTPNGQTLHDTLDFFGWPELGSKDFVLTHGGDGQYEAKGEVINYEFEGASRRVVVTDLAKLDEKGGAFDWQATRADYFDRNSNGGAGGIEYFSTYIYLIWSATNDSNPDPDLPGKLKNVGRQLIKAGPANPGGQRGGQN